MEKRLDRIEEKVDLLQAQIEAQKESTNARAETLNRAAQMIMSMNDKMGEISTTLARNTVDIEHHIRRTDIAEEKLELLKAEVDANSKFKDRVEWTFKLVGIACTGLGLFFGAIKALEAAVKWVS